MPEELIHGQPATPAAPTEPAAAPAPAPAPEPTLEEAALAALDEGIAAEQPAAEPVTPEPKEPAAEPVPGTPEAAAAEAAKAEAAKVAAAQKEGVEPAKPEPTADEQAIDKEITDRGLKGDTATRFRELANQVRELSPLKDALEKAGIKEAAHLPQLVQHASDYRELIGMVQDTGASPEQYGQALNYLKIVNAANGGDAKAAEAAYAIMHEELTSLAKMLGKEVPGVHDPLAEHPDLAKQVEGGEVTRAVALETARLRTAARMEDGRRQIEAQRGNQQAEQTQAVADLNALGAQLAASDPHFQAKAPALLAALQEIRASVPPARWAATARALYARLPNPAPAAAPAPAPAAAKPTPGPVRGNTVRPAVTPVTDDPLEALEQGIAAANG